MDTKEGIAIIHSVWKASGISHALKDGKACFQPLSPFYDIDLIVESDKYDVDINFRVVCELTDSQLSIGDSRKNDVFDESCRKS